MAFAAAILALIPGLAWLYFYLHEDPYPEPKLLVAKTFIAGGACAFVALAAQIGLQKLGLSFSLASDGSLSGMGMLIVTLLAFSLVEELCKFGAAYVTVHSDPGFKEPIDAMIYCIVAALGFATIENIGAVQHDVSFMSPHGAALGIIMQTLTLRFVGATLLHTLSSGLIGYYWAQQIRNFRSGGLVLVGIGLATGLHAIFNYLIISYGSLIYAVGFIVVIGISILGDFEKLKPRAI
jgi:protease PrsW